MPSSSGCRWRWRPRWPSCRRSAAATPIPRSSSTSGGSRDGRRAGVIMMAAEGDRLNCCRLLLLPAQAKLLRAPSFGCLWKRWSKSSYMKCECDARPRVVRRRLPTLGWVHCGAAAAFESLALVADAPYYVVEHTRVRTTYTPGRGRGEKSETASSPWLLSSFRPVDRYRCPDWSNSPPERIRIGWRCSTRFG